MEVVKKVLTRSPGTTISSIGSSLGIPSSTLHGWIKAMDNKNFKEHSLKNEKKPFEWSVEEKLKAVSETFSLSQEEIAAYCRKQGIFPHHLEAWKKDFIQRYSLEKEKESRENKHLKIENKKLHHELRRKEKALAEAAALLVLKKKVTDLWSNEEDE